MKRHATLSTCGKYRYDLIREWNPESPRVAFVMLNPSTADGTDDDPTIRRCIDFAKRLGGGSLIVWNLFAYRSPAPEALSLVADPIGPRNAQYHTEAILHAQDGGLVIAAWGASRHANGQNILFMRRFSLGAVPLYRLGPPTKSGRPRHPLYLSKHEALQLHAGTRTEKTWSPEK